MNEHDHRIFFTGLDFRRRNLPALNIESFVRPLDAFGLAPASLQSSVVVRQLPPFAERAGEDFWWQVVTAKFRRRDFAVLR